MLEKAALRAKKPANWSAVQLIRFYIMGTVVFMTFLEQNVLLHSGPSQANPFHQNVFCWIYILFKKKFERLRLEVPKIFKVVKTKCKILKICKKTLNFNLGHNIFELCKVLLRVWFAKLKWNSIPCLKIFS